MRAMMVQTIARVRCRWARRYRCQRRPSACCRRRTDSGIVPSGGRHVVEWEGRHIRLHRFARLGDVGRVGVTHPGCPKGGVAPNHDAVAAVVDISVGAGPAEEGIAALLGVGRITLSPFEGRSHARWQRRCCRCKLRLYSSFHRAVMMVSSVTAYPSPGLRFRRRHSSRGRHSRRGSVRRGG